MTTAPPASSLDELLAELETAAPDGRDARLARGAAGLLRAFNLAGVIVAADVHVAQRLAALAGAGPVQGVLDLGTPAAGAGQQQDGLDDPVLLATALAVRAPRLGHVCVDLATIASTASSDLDVPVDLRRLPWPDVGPWCARLAGSPLVGSEGQDRPLRLEGTALYLDRYWSLERQVAADLEARAAADPPAVDEQALEGGLDRLFGAADGTDLQRLAATAAVSGRLSVIAGGPGTGKTTTVARVLALLFEQAAATGARPPLAALAAPTGKAAARLQEAVHDAADRLDVHPDVRARLLELRGATLHRLLGYRPGNRSRFRHDRHHHLAHDVVVVDETSMVPLSLMARLVEAVRPDARLVLVGDPEQLASVEAGAVLGDIVGPAAHGLRMGDGARATLERRSGQPVPATPPPPDVRLGDGIVVLERLHRFAGGIAELAAAVRAGDADAAIALLQSGREELRWIEWDATGPPPRTGVAPGTALAPLRDRAAEAGVAVTAAARAGDAATALSALGRFRVLCAHRRGPAGAAAWGEAVEHWILAATGGAGEDGPWYAGRPLLVTANDYSLRLFNGDTGVVVAAAPGRLAAAFERAGEIVEVSPTRLAAVETVHAMTVHKSQGSQFDTVAVVLPPPDSPVLTRELLYTAVTRARRSVLVAGTEAALRTAVGRPIARSSGLGRRLWGAG